MGRILTSITLALSATAVSAAPTLAPGLVNYQGLLRDSAGDPLATADYEISFKLYEDHLASAEIWGPQTFASVPVAVGHFNVILGPQDDLARDLTEEVFLVAWRRLDGMPEVDAALPWLYGVAHRVLLNQRRGARRRQRLIAKLAFEPREPPPGPESRRPRCAPRPPRSACPIRASRRARSSR